MRTCVLIVATMNAVSKRTNRAITLRVKDKSQMFVLKVLSHDNNNRTAVAIGSQMY